METRAFRLTVRFLLSTVPAPCGVQKPTGPLSSKTLPPLSSFYSGYVMCNGVACGSLLVEALHPPPGPGRKGQSQTSSLPGTGFFPAGQGRTPGWGSEQCPFVICTLTFIHRADRKKAKPRAANPVGLAQGCEPPCALRDSREPCLVWKKHLITAPNCAA